jgi:hypothetical protein
MEQADLLQRSATQLHRSVLHAPDGNVDKSSESARDIVPYQRDFAGMVHSRLRKAD